MASKFNRLIPDIVWCISEFLDPESELAILRQVSRRIRSMIRKPELNLRIESFTLNIDLVKWALRNGYKWNDQSGIAMVSYGNDHTLKESICLGCPVTVRTVDMVISIGKTETLEWLLQNGADIDPYAIRTAIYADRLDMVQWIYANIPDRVSKFGSQDAATAGNLEILKWMRRFEGRRWCIRKRNMMLDIASGYGDLKMMKWARSKGCCYWTAESIASAAFNGKFEMVKYMRSEGCPWDCSLIRNAVSQDFPEIAQWAIESGCPQW